MNCIEFEAALELSIETRQPLEFLSLEELDVLSRVKVPRVHGAEAPGKPLVAALKHTLECESCRREWEIHCQLDTVIDAWRSEIGIQALTGLTDQQMKAFAAGIDPASLPAGLRDSVLAELIDPALTRGLSQPDAGTHHGLPRTAIHSKSEDSDSLRRSGILAVASVAACLALAVIFATNQARRSSFDLARVSPAPAIEQPITVTPLDVSQTLTAVFSDIRSEYREMASETTAVARDLVNVFPQHVSVPFQATHDELELHPTSGDVVRIWRPISSQVESALGFLWQAVPSEVPAG
ncbi:MAG: hypothetical protein WCH39_24975 [Schlesneria sp.]